MKKERPVDRSGQACSPIIAAILSVCEREARGSAPARSLGDPGIDVGAGEPGAVARWLSSQGGEHVS